MISNCLPILTLNPWPSAWNFKSFSRSLEQFFLTTGQKKFGNKIPMKDEFELELSKPSPALNKKGPTKKIECTFNQSSFMRKIPKYVITSN